jgi:hypothetical protein
MAVLAGVALGVSRVIRVSLHHFSWWRMNIIVLVAVLLVLAVPVKYRGYLGFWRTALRIGLMLIAFNVTLHSGWHMGWWLALSLVGVVELQLVLWKLRVRGQSNSDLIVRA